MKVKISQVYLADAAQLVGNQLGALGAGVALSTELTGLHELVFDSGEEEINAFGVFDPGTGAVIDPEPRLIPGYWWRGAWTSAFGVYDPGDGTLVDPAAEPHNQPIIDLAHSELRWTSGEPPVTQRFLGVFYLVDDLQRLVDAKTPASPPPPPKDADEFMRTWPHDIVKQCEAVPECNHVTGATWRKCLDAWHRLPDERKNSGPGRPKGSKNKSSK